MAGDFDGDDDVDGADFLEWQRTDGTPAGLSDWQTNYANGSFSTIATVPEPTSILLLSSFIALAASTRDRQRLALVTS